MSKGWKIRKAQERGITDLGWLKSRHSFSFGDYYDPDHSGFRTLRVMNEDVVAEGAGFPTHPHRDMEIFSYVLEGALAHRDSMGNEKVLLPGQIQLMSAGTGVTHSEYNADQEHPTHFLQIWILPQTRGLVPGYREWHPWAEHQDAGKTLVLSGDGRAGSALIHQDADIYRLMLKKGETVTHELPADRGLWVQVMRGAIHCDGMQLETGDGAGNENPGMHTFYAPDPTEVLLFDLA